MGRGLGERELSYADAYGDGDGNAYGYADGAGMDRVAGECEPVQQLHGNGKRKSGSGVGLRELRHSVRSGHRAGSGGEQRVAWSDEHTGKQLGVHT